VAKVTQEMEEIKASFASEVSSVAQEVEGSGIP